jgi:MarR family transcriptional regulator, transcriptional regulator for hemolysin
MATTATASAAPDLSFLLAHTSHVLATRMTAELAGIGLTPRALCVLMHAQPGELTQIELASAVDLDKTTMVITVDELEAAGYALRVTSPADRRARLVTVTDAGRRVVAAGRKILDRVHGEVLDAVPPASRAAFVEALTTLAGGYLASPVECERPVRRARQPTS